MYQEPVRPTHAGQPPQAGPRPPRPRPGAGSLWAGVALIACLVLAAPIVLALVSAPDAATTGAGASAEPTATPAIKPKTDKAPSIKDWSALKDWTGWPGVMLPGSFGDMGRGAVTVTAITGSNLSLATSDGWKRTITVTADTKISKGGQPIAVADIKVGDAIRFTQKRNADGTYAITSIVVPTARTGGEVTAVSGDKITVKLRDGSTQVITVTTSTVYTLGRASGTKADVKVGVDIVAAGTLDGTAFTAMSVNVALAQVAGEVTATTSSTITLKARDGTTTVVHVAGTTKFRVKGKAAPTIGDIAVGDRVQTAGTRRADGSVDALSVVVLGPMHSKAEPKASPSSSAATS